MTRSNPKVKSCLFALTNSPVFANLNANVNTVSNFGRITRLAVAANGATNGGGYRIIRLALKFSF